MYSAVNTLDGPSKTWPVTSFGPEVADGVAIAQYDASPEEGFYVFWLRDGEVIADTLYYSVGDAVLDAEQNFDDVEWIEVFKPRRDRVKPPPGWPRG